MISAFIVAIVYSAVPIAAITIGYLVIRRDYAPPHPDRTPAAHEEVR